MDAPPPLQEHDAPSLPPDLVLPLVRWQAPPDVRITCVHVLPPRATDSDANQTQGTAVDDQDALGVVAGTADGRILYWRFHHDTVVHVTLLVMMPHGAHAPVVGLASGTDEFGHTILLAATGDGAGATWYVPSGACRLVDATLAVDGAPLWGIEMLAKRRYAVLASTVAPWRVWDAWDMTVLVCVDTMQEQLCRHVTVAERPCNDALVLSLGDHGLVQSFRWTPAGRAVLRASWLVSWPDDALDVLCTAASASDALIAHSACPAARQSRACPIALQVSPDASLVLILWSTKFALLERTWLCPVDDDDDVRTNSRGAICTVRPSDAVVHDNHEPTTTRWPDEEWTHAEFGTHDHVLLWTTRGSMFTVSTTDVATSRATLYLFTKAPDQLVPRATMKPLGSLSSLTYVRAIACGKGCDRALDGGHVTCVRTNSAHPVVVHVCPRGDVTRWVHDTNEPLVSSLRDGFPAVEPCSITHWMLGRYETASMTSSDVWRRAPSRACVHARPDDVGVLDIPLVVQGYDDGSISVAAVRAKNASRARVKGHAGRVTAIAHCRWECEALARVSLSLVDVARMVDPRARGVSCPTKVDDETVRGEEKVDDETGRGEEKVDDETGRGEEKVDDEGKPTPSLTMMLFTGAADGSFHVWKVVLYDNGDDGKWSHTVTSLQSFRRHRGAIEQICVSPWTTRVGTSGHVVPDRLVATLGRDRTICIYAPTFVRTARQPVWTCRYELSGHGDALSAVTWHLERGLLDVACDDQMVYVWNLDHGVLERVVPIALISVRPPDEPDTHHPLATLWVGRTCVQLLRFDVGASAQQLKSIWRSHRGVHASSTLPLVLLSLVLSWGQSRALDAALGTVVGLAPVDEDAALYSCALEDASSGALTVPLPWTIARQVHGPLQWRHSPPLSAHVALAIVAFSLEVMADTTDDAAFQSVWSHVMTQHAVELPTTVARYCEPSLETLAGFGFHASEATQLAGRTMLRSVLERMGRDARQLVAATYAAHLHWERRRPRSERTTSAGRLGAVVMLLSTMGTVFPGDVAPTCAREVCDVLVQWLYARTDASVVAADLLTHGLLLFRPHLVDLASLLLALVWMESPSARRLLVQVCAYESAFVLGLLEREMHARARPRGSSERILLVLTELVGTQGLLLYRHLPICIATILASLDPTKPAQRRRCLALATRCLYGLVQRFPMVAFHQETQRLALGTMDALIVLYDLRTATKWRVLEGHASAVSVVSFCKEGHVLVSYAAQDRSVRWWNSGAAGLFGGMLAMHQPCLKEHKLSALQVHAHVDLAQIVETCRLQVLPRHETSEHEREAAQIVRLTREDASQVQFLL
ncbi:hypothetical protein PsorP6_018027 [Peronosclerospora sorghi]|uniref:Uncharacterized protein n=1 Tax=Peronosclerospora sorghi TaxID=230839 RepID=A0ACC0WBR1_9STRA|nr:hypothetical protein PsorP6_018027 [Peronosclerospora sorghi]